MRLIITRPVERALPLAERLTELGAEPILVPMLKIEAVPFDPPEQPIQGIIFTSVQGVEAAAKRPELHIFPVYAVGSKTAGAASAAGFQTVHNADGDVEALFQLVMTSCNAGKGLLLHLSGGQTTGQLVERLDQKGFQANRVKVYEARPETSMPTNVLDKIKRKAFDGVAFFSPRTAHIFNQVVEEAGVTNSFGNAFALCLSDRVAQEVEKLNWKKIHIADNPTEQGMLTLLQGLRT